MPSDGMAVRGVAKVRRNHSPQAAEMRADPERGASAVRVVFDEPVKAPAPGQALVVYDGAGCVLGGGWITAATA